MTQGGTHPRVCMIVANDVTNDTRVKKTALSVARRGFEVTIVAVARNGVRSETNMGPVRIVRVPVEFTIRDERARHAKPTAAAPTAPSKRKLRRDARERRIMKAELTAERHDLEARIGAFKQRDAGASPDRSLAERLRRRQAWRRLLAERDDFRRREARFRAERDAVDPTVDQTHILESYRDLDWRELVPEVLDFERAYDKVMRQVDPDIVHAHDFPMVGIAVRYAQRARAAGRTVRTVYDAHEYTAGVALPDPRRTVGYLHLEREHIKGADAVTTVSSQIAVRLQQDHGLPTLPAVVLNVPLQRELPDSSVGDVRQLTGVAPATPLVVYSGNIAPERRLDLLVRAVGALDTVHLVIVSDAPSPRLDPYRKIAEDGGFASRVHVVPYAPPDRVAEYLSTASLGVHPLSDDHLNHHLALPNKLFEYLHAGLPLVVSSNPTMAEFVTSHGLGEVFRAGDADDLAEKISKVLEVPDSYREAASDPALIARYSWQGQEPVLHQVYDDLTEGGASARAEDLPFSLTEQVAPDHVRTLRPPRPRAKRKLAIGPSNMAGQPWEWARALEQLDADTAVEVFALQRDHGFPADHLMPPDQWHELSWQLRHAERLLSRFTHVLFEAGHPLLGTLNGRTFDHDVPAFRQRGIAAGVVLHGSEIRSPRAHRRLERHSPFVADNDDLVKRLQQRADDLAARLEAFDGDIFITTLGLVDFVHDARWLPLTVDPRLWVSQSPPFTDRRPVVANIPTSGRLKGSAYVSAACRRLSERGLINYQPLRGVPYSAMPAVIENIDVLIDGLVLGDYGATACQAMAAGRLVVGHVSEQVRGRIPGGVPIVQATPETLEQVLLGIVADPEAAADRAARGPAFVRQYHDGRRAAAVLKDWMDSSGDQRKGNG